MQEPTFITSSSNWPLNNNDENEYLVCTYCYYPIVKHEYTRFKPCLRNTSKIIFGYELNIKDLLDTAKPPKEAINKFNKIFCCRTLTFIGLDEENTINNTFNENIAILNPDKVFCPEAPCLKENYLERKKTNNRNNSTAYSEKA